MAETAMKFGPEWLRTLSVGKTMTPITAPSGVSTKHKLADFRYGREEMLALLDLDHLRPPDDDFKEFSALYMEKTQKPLAVIPFAEEEQQLWARCVNSEAVLRLFSKPGDRDWERERDRDGVGRGGMGSIRGGSIDRGRGRGRGFYGRPAPGYEESEGPGSFINHEKDTNRSQSWDQGGGNRFDPKHAPIQEGETNGWKDYGPRGGVGQRDGSWRSKTDRDYRGDDDGDHPPGNRDRWRGNITGDSAGVRNDKWSRGRDSWRERDDRYGGRSYRGGESGGGTYSARNRPPGGKPAWDEDYEGGGDTRGRGLPEWSTEDEPSEKVGSFDGSGAFLETKTNHKAGLSEKSRQKLEDNPKSESIDIPSERRKLILDENGMTNRANVAGSSVGSSENGSASSLSSFEKTPKLDRKEQQNRKDVVSAKVIQEKLPLMKAPVDAHKEDTKRVSDDVKPAEREARKVPAEIHKVIPQPPPEQRDTGKEPSNRAPMATRENVNKQMPDQSMNHQMQENHGLPLDFKSTAPPSLPTQTAAAPVASHASQVFSDDGNHLKQFAQTTNVNTTLDQLFFNTANLNTRPASGHELFGSSAFINNHSSSSGLGHGRGYVDGSGMLGSNSGLLVNSSQMVGHSFGNSVGLGSVSSAFGNGSGLGTASPALGMFTNGFGVDAKAQERDLMMKNNMFSGGFGGFGIGNNQMAADEDSFAHLKRDAEKLVSLWSQEEDSKALRQTAPAQMSYNDLGHHENQNHHIQQQAPLAHNGMKSHHSELDDKWCYRDPQGSLQGPFSSSEMLEWYQAGYFQMNLLVRHGRTDSFVPLGDMVKRLNCVPFTPQGISQLVEARAANVMQPSASVSASSVHRLGDTGIGYSGAPQSLSNDVPGLASSKSALFLQQKMALQQHLQPQFVQQQYQLRQQLLHSGVNQAKCVEALEGLAQRQQQYIDNLLLQAGAQLTHQREHSAHDILGGGGVSDNDNTKSSLTNNVDSLFSSFKNSLSKSDSKPELSSLITGPPKQLSAESVWNSRTDTWDVGGTTRTSPIRSDSTQQMRDEIEHQFVVEERERRAKLEAERRVAEEEAAQLKKDAAEEKRAKAEEEKRKKELLEAEKKKQKELETKKRKEQEELRKKQAASGEAEKKKKEQQQKKQKEHQEKELLRLKQQQAKELESKAQIETSTKSKKADTGAKSQTPLTQPSPWQLINSNSSDSVDAFRKFAMKVTENSQPAPPPPSYHQPPAQSLLEIQQAEAETERQRQSELKLLAQRDKQMHAEQKRAAQAAAIAAQDPNSNPWAQRNAAKSVKSLAEIQQEEAVKAAKDMDKQRKQEKQKVVQQLPLATAAVWGSGGAATLAASLSASNIPPQQHPSPMKQQQQNPVPNTPPQPSAWGATPLSSFLDSCDVTSASQLPPQQKKGKGAGNKSENHSVNSNSQPKKAPKKKDESVLNMFQPKQKDEFTDWCKEALSAFESSVDINTFVAFLKDVESPYEVHDYVKSYYGDSKSSRDFAKQFIDKRCRFKNKAKQAAQQQELMWGPAKAVNPGQKPSAANNNNAPSEQQSRLQQLQDQNDAAKKKKNKMQRVDNSILGFTVHAAIDRVNVGEIERVDT